MDRTKEPWHAGDRFHHWAIVVGIVLLFVGFGAIKLIYPEEIEYIDKGYDIYYGDINSDGVLTITITIHAENASDYQNIVNEAFEQIKKQYVPLKIRYPTELISNKTRIVMIVRHLHPKARPK